MAIRDRFDFSNLSTHEKHILARELLIEAEQEEDSAPIAPELLAELQRRIDAVNSGAMKTYSWEEVQAKIWPNHA